MDNGRVLKRSHTWADLMLNGLEPSLGACKREQGRGRLVPEKRPVADKTRGRGRPRTMLKHASEPGNLVSVLLEGLFEDLL